MRCVELVPTSAQRKRDGCLGAISHKIFGSSPEERPLQNGTKTEQLSPHQHGHHRDNVAVLALVSILFIILFTMQNVLVKFQNEELDVNLPWLTAVMLTLGWPLNGFILLYFDGFKSIDVFWIIKRYGLLGFLDALHLSLLSFGLNNLPGSTYTLLKGSAVVFNVILSRIILRKKIPALHYISVIIICASTTVTGFAKGVDHTDVENDPKRWIWVICAVGSAFANAFQAVIAQYLFDVKSKEKSMRIVAETTFFNGVFSFIFLLAPVFVSEEYMVWGGAFSETKSNGQLAAFIVSCMGIGASKQLGYFTKFAAVSHSTALYAGVLDTVRRAVVVIAVVLLFDEKFSWQKGIATLLTFVGFGVYILGSHLKRRSEKKRRRKMQIQRMESQEVNNSALNQDEIGLLLNQQKNLNTNGVHQKFGGENGMRADGEFEGRREKVVVDVL